MGGLNKRVYVCDAGGLAWRICLLSGKQRCRKKLIFLRAFGERKAADEQST